MPFEIRVNIAKIARCRCVRSAVGRAPTCAAQKCPGVIWLSVAVKIDHAVTVEINSAIWRAICPTHIVGQLAVRDIWIIGKIIGITQKLKILERVTQIITCARAQAV